jgi:hypothetical protein
MSLYTYGQDCAVEKESLKGTYTGDCKKEKLMGKEKLLAMIHTKANSKWCAGWTRVYTWSNKNMFDGRM